MSTFRQDSNLPKWIAFFSLQDTPPKGKKVKILKISYFNFRTKNGFLALILNVLILALKLHKTLCEFLFQNWLKIQNFLAQKKFRWVFFKHCGIIVFTGNDISSERFFKRGSAQTNAWWRFFAHYSFMHWKHTWAERKILRLMQENNPHYSLASFDSLTSVELRNWFSTQGWCWTEAKAIQGVPTRSAF